jgi:hypothetical protein
VSNQEQPRRAHERERRHVKPGRMVRVGLIALVASVFLVLLPFAVPLGGLAKYVVVPGLIGACFGLSCMLNGWIDATKGGE